jgi:hypothetical protein
MRANSTRRESVVCTGCNTSVYPTGRRWVPISQLCLACDTKKNDADALRRAHNLVDSTTTTVRGLLDSQFAFFLEVSVHSAVKFTLFSIYNIQTDQRGVDHANGGNGALPVSCSKRGNTLRKPL